MDKIRRIRLKILARKWLQSLANPDYSAMPVCPDHFVICRAPTLGKHAEKALKEAVDCVLEPFSSSRRSHHR